jgi:hypothetical protein
MQEDPAKSCSGARLSSSDLPYDSLLIFFCLRVSACGPDAFDAMQAKTMSKLSAETVTDVIKTILKVCVSCICFHLMVSPGCMIV